MKLGPIFKSVVSKSLPFSPKIILLIVEAKVLDP